MISLDLDATSADAVKDYIDNFGITLFNVMCQHNQFLLAILLSNIVPLSYTCALNLHLSLLKFILLVSPHSSCLSKIFYPNPKVSLLYLLSFCNLSSMSFINIY